MRKGVRRIGRFVGAPLVCGALLLSCVSGEERGGSEGTSSLGVVPALPPHSSSSPFGDVPRTERARDKLRSLREAFETISPASRRSTLVSLNADGPSDDAPSIDLAAPNDKPTSTLFPTSEVQARSETAEVHGVGDAGGFELRDKASGATIEVQLLGTQSSRAEEADGYVVREKALRVGADLIQKRIAEGIEDFVHFPDAPERPQLEYLVTLKEGIAALRQIGNTLEFLDAKGDPRLRIAPPYLVDASKRHLDLDLHVEGAEVDRDPAPPWDREIVSPGAKQFLIRLEWVEQTQYPALVDPVWSTTGNTAVARSAHTLTKLTNGRVLVVGGAGTSAYVQGPQGLFYLNQPGTAVVELYNPATGTWSLTGSVASRHSHVAELLNDGRVLIAGGLDGTEEHGEGEYVTRYVSTAQLHNPTTGTWSSAAPPLSGFRARAASTLLDDGTVLVSGGSANAGLTAETYAPSTNSWSATGNTSRVRSRHESIKLSDGRVLLVGGDNPANATSEIYNPTTRTFGTAKALPGGLGIPAIETDYGYSFSHALTLTRLANGEVLGASHRALVYNPTNHTWRDVGAPLLARTGGHTAELLPDGNVLLVGGETLKSDDAHLAAEIFRPGYYGGLWTPAPRGASSDPLQYGPARNGLRSVRLDNGKVLLQGGIKTELYDHPDIPVTVSDYRVPLSGWQPTPHQISHYEGRIYRPTNLVGSATYPLIVIIHMRSAACIDGSGNLAAWDYQIDGCPPGFVSRQLYKGYGYFAEELARQGYFVVSINWESVSATTHPDGDEIFNDLIEPIQNAVGHNLGLIGEWSTGAKPTPPELGVSLQGRINWSQLGIVGHSNGGAAAVRIANTNPGVRAVLGLAFSTDPVSLVTNPLPSSGINWVGVYPSCDRDGATSSIWYFNKRAELSETSGTFAALHTVPGANHHFYNTQVAVEEPWYCGNITPLFSQGATSSVPQLQTGLRAILALILGKVGPNANPLWIRTFDPLRKFPAFPQPRNGYLDSRLSLENFSQPTGTSQYGYATATTGSVTVQHTIPGATISWTGSGTWQTNSKPANQGQNLSSYTWLDISVARTSSSLNSTSQGNFKVALVRSDGSVSSQAPYSGGFELEPPTGFGTVPDRWLVNTRRIPLSAFGGSLSSIRGVRLYFGPTTGEVKIAHIRASKPHNP